MESAQSDPSSEKRVPGRPSHASKAAAGELAELTQLEHNAILENVLNIEMLLEALQQACVLIRQKDQLEHQVDALSRQSHDLRIVLDREQSRLAEAKATRLEYARG
jgi:hypothetical protein